jgi:hypothetical protein
MCKYKKRDCAIKLIFAMDVTADEIRRVVAEATILASIKVWVCICVYVCVCVSVYVCVYV